MAKEIKVASLPRNNREWFLTYLFNDEDFVQSKKELSDDLRTLMGDKGFGIFLLLSSREGIIRQLEKRSKNDDDTSLEYKIISDVRKLAKRFNVTVDTVEQGIRYSNNLSGLTIKNTPAVYIDDDEVVIRLNSTMRLSDIKKIYPYVSQLQSTLPNYQVRNRSKVRPDLIYAIYKQRLRGVTFKEIFRHYEKGQLPDYDGDKSIVGEESLGRIYRKYKPDV